MNFVHDVNVLRKTLKSVYANSADLKALNSELGVGHGNCRIQVLPVCWRHLLDFPRQRGKRGEHDLGDMDEGEFPCEHCLFTTVFQLSGSTFANVAAQTRLSTTSR